MKVSRETCILSIICLLDLGTTIWLVSIHHAREGNMVMGYFLDLGYLPFIFAKVVMFLCPLALLEWARRRNPQFVKVMLRCGIAAYIGIYCTGVYKINANRQEDALQAQYRAFIDKWASQPAPKGEFTVRQTKLLTMMHADLDER